MRLPLYICCSFVARRIFRLFCRVHVVVLERPPSEGPFILASNHISHFDPALLSAFFPRPIHWMGMKELFQHRWSARFFSWLGVIPVDRLETKTGSHRSAFKKIKRSLAAGKVLGIFPEGGIRSGAASILEGAPMKQGLATMSLWNQVPIVPCVIIGTDQLYAPWAWLTRPQLWIIIGKKIIPPTVASIDRSEQLFVVQEKLQATFPALQQELCERFQLSDAVLPKTAKERNRHLF